MNSIINKIPKPARTVAVLAFWVIVWWIIAVEVNRPVLVASPSEVFERFKELAVTNEFYIIVFSSVFRILGGFVIAVAAGCLIGICTAKIQIIDELVSPILSVIKATPVASFIILALVWLNKQSIPAFISFLMVMPIIHGNVSTGIKNTPIELIEMTRMYRFSFKDKLLKLYIPSVYPYFRAGFKTSLGLAWKAGVAAEVLCFPHNSIGKELYEAKTYLETVDVFTWTVTVIIISVIIEKILLWSVNSFKIKKTPEGSV